MASSKKRNYCSADVSEEREPPSKQLRCILHSSTARNPGVFISIKNVRGGPSAKLDLLHDIRSKRLSQPDNSVLRMQEVCEQIPDSLDDLDLDSTGYHRQCYQTFTNHLTRLKNTEEVKRHHSPRKQQKISTTRSSLFPPECIFCDRIEIKISGKKTERPIKFTLAHAWESIGQWANELGKSSLHRKVQDKDLFAMEAQFHPYCRLIFQTEYRNHLRAIHKPDHLSNTDQARQTAAHEKAFQTVCDFIMTNVIDQSEIVQLSSLRLMYIGELDARGFPNENYRSEKLINRLQNNPEINKRIAFTKITPDDRGCFSFYLVYSAQMTTADAVSFAYKLASADKNRDVALLLRGIIRRAFRETASLPWPPTADDLTIRPDILPNELVKFLNIVMSGKPEVTCENTKRLVLSIGQDICRSVTDGEWKLPKHILLCTTLRHLYRSKQLTTIINRLGHCESYDFGLELETAQAKAIDDVSTYLTQQIVTGDSNALFHSEWDNLNKIMTNVHGSNVVNSAGGIMMQETEPDSDSLPHERTLPTYDRTHERSLKVPTPKCLPPLHIYNRAGPRFPPEASFRSLPENDERWNAAMLEYYVWIIARNVGSHGQQPIPALGGFISATGKVPMKRTNIDYYTPINEPITQYSTVAELLRQSAEATAEVGQRYVISTYDLGVCMKALPLVWKWPEKYKDHIVLIGQFHVGMNYLDMLCGHKMQGSGYTEILIEEQLVTTGCVRGVLNGKAYAKSLFCLKVVCEAMERLLMEQFILEENVGLDDPQAVLNILQNCDRESVDKALKDPAMLSLIEHYQQYENKVRRGHLGKTGVFWFSFIEHARLLFMLLYSVKVNSLQLFHKCMGQMADLFFAYGGQNYARYLTWFEAFLTNIELTHPGATSLLEKGAIAVARSLIPGSLSAVDKTMEETFMKFAKSTGGLSGLFNMFPAYQRFCRTTSVRAQFYEKTLDMCDMITDPECPKAGKHRELEPAEVKKGEEAVQRTIAAIQSFTNPFTIPDKDKLYSLASGAPASPDVEMDVLRAEAAGKGAKETFIKERFQNHTSETTFFEPVKKMKLLTMEANTKKVQLTSTKGKLIQYQKQGNIAFQLLVKSQLLDEPIDFTELMRYPLTAVSHCLGTPDGFMAKTNKASLLHYLLEDYTDEVVYPEGAFYIQDGNALIHSMKNLPGTFGAICLKVLDHMVPKNNFIFSTDSYFEDSIKTQERLRRGVSQKFIVDGPATRKPPDMQLFLQNDGNKEQLFDLLLRVWSTSEAATRLDNCPTAILIVKGRAYKLEASDGNVKISEIPELLSNQEETDTRIILYLNYAASSGHKSAVVRTPDTDIFVILLYYAHTIKLSIYMDTGVGKHRKLLDVSAIAQSLGKDYCEVLLGFHVFTGEDCTSAFKGKGKVGPLKKLQKYPRHQEAFRLLGSEWIVSPDLYRQLEYFTCTMYGYPRETSLDKVRALMLKKMVGEGQTLTSRSKVELSRLPPCANAHAPHVDRVNHRVALYKRSHIPVYQSPKPFDGQGWVMDNGHLQPVWSNGPILPPSLVDLIEMNEESDEDGDDDDGTIEYEELLAYLDNDIDDDV